MQRPRCEGVNVCFAVLCFSLDRHCCFISLQISLLLPSFQFFISSHLLSTNHDHCQVNELKRAIETESNLVKEKEAAALSMQQQEANLRAEVALLKARKDAAEATLLELPSMMSTDQVHVQQSTHAHARASVACNCVIITVDGRLVIFSSVKLLCSWLLALVYVYVLYKNLATESAERVAQLESELAKPAPLVNDAENEVASASANQSQASKDAAKLSAQLNALRASAAVAEDQEQDLLAAAAESANEIAALKTMLEAWPQERARLEQEKAEAPVITSALNQDLSAVQAERTMLENAVAEASAQCQAARESLAKERAALKPLEASYKRAQKACSEEERLVKRLRDQKEQLTAEV